MMATGSDGYYWGKAHLLYDDPAKISRAPDDTEGHLVPQFAELGSPVQNELLIVSPYFVPGDTGVAWLRGLVKRGVRVTVLTNSLAATDVGAVHAGYQRYRKALLEAGVRLYELKPEAIEYERAKREKAALALHAPRCTPRLSCSTGVRYSSARSTSIRVRSSSIPRSAWCARARLWPRSWPAALEQKLDRIAWRLESLRCLRRQAHSLGGDRRRWPAGTFGRTRGECLAQVLGVVPRAAADRVPALKEGVRRSAVLDQ